MTHLFELVTGLSSIVKVGWILWLSWAVAQICWYWMAREQDAAPAADDHVAGWPPLREDRLTISPPRAERESPWASHTESVSEAENTWGQRIADTPSAAEPELSTPAASMLPSPSAPASKSSKRRRRAAATSSPSAA